MGAMSTNQSLFQGFHHVAIRASDFEASVRFYIEGLSMKEKIRWGGDANPAIMIDSGAGDYIEIFGKGKNARPTDKFPEFPILHYALRVTNCDEAVARAVKAGAELTMEAKDVTLSAVQGPVKIRIAFVKGLDGEVIEFFENSAT